MEGNILEKCTPTKNKNYQNKEWSYMTHRTHRTSIAFAIVLFVGCIIMIIGLIASFISLLYYVFKDQPWK